MTMFSLPASQKETNEVRNAIEELRASLAQSSALAEKALETMRENYVAIDCEYRKELLAASRGIDAALFQMNMSLYKMKQHKERIITAEKFDF